MKRKKKIISAVLGICMLSVSLGAALPKKVLAKETQEIEITADAKAVSPVRLSLGDGQTAPKYKQGAGWNFPESKSDEQRKCSGSKRSCDTGDRQCLRLAV